MQGKGRAKLGAVAALTLSLWLTACGDCEDETAAAQQFLTTRSNLVCQSNADCKVVSTGCTHPARSFCGQATLNQAAAENGRWKALQADLTDCGNECAQCGAALMATCTSGFCGGPP